MGELLADLLNAAIAAEKTLAEAEHAIENEWGCVCSRAEWELGLDPRYGPSDELTALRLAIRNCLVVPYGGAKK